MTVRRYAIIGTGAVGGFYGTKLTRAGLDVHFLLHSDYAHVRDNGLRLDSVDGDIVLPRVNAYARAADIPPVDVALVALKTTRNHLLGELLAPLVANGADVLMLQNGLGNEAAAARAAPGAKVLGGLCFLCSNKAGPGHITHLDYGFVTFGEHRDDGCPAGVTDTVRHLAADFRSAGIETKTADDIAAARWKKLIWNVPFNGLSVVLDTLVDGIIACDHTRLLAEQLMREVAAASTACGRPIGEKFIRYMMGLTEKMTPYRTSMKIDHELKRPMEIEAIFGAPLAAAAAAGCACPRIETLYRQLKFIDARRDRV
ncbi:MAG: putative 2-dehydropantoate 2-reductase [Phycisphaerae bacterium]|nr:putative 2-dehydropantoate 2-reductase [Phycisphaerae bacterium]